MSNNSNINQELHDLGIKLPNVSLPYTVPDQYFDGLASSIKEQIEAEDFLEALPKPLPFEVQAKYFSEFNVESPKGLTANRTNKWWKPVIGLAASLALAIGLLVWINKPAANNIEEAIAAIPVEDVQNYLIENANDEDLNSIANNYSAELPNINLNGVSDEEIQDYIDPYSAEL